MTAFKEKIIAFVDVLGFKKLVIDAEQGVGQPLPDILSFLKLLGTGAERARFDNYGPTCCPCAPFLEKNLDFRVTQISDCVVVSAEVSPAGVINVVSHCWGAVIELLNRGIMCRGYIKRGSLYIKLTRSSWALGIRMHTLLSQRLARLSARPMTGGRHTSKSIPLSLNTYPIKATRVSRRCSLAW